MATSLRTAAPDTLVEVVPPQALSLPAWRELLVERWEQRLYRLTELSLAYHDACTRGNPEDARMRQLLREATAARRALSDTEEALARLSGGGFGRCEQCSAAIAADALLDEPETRYCAQCLHAASRIPSARIPSAR